MEASHDPENLMRKLIWISSFFILTLAAFLLLTFTSTRASADGLILSSPGACPTGGCAAGQRLNFLASFSVVPVVSSDPNTQICVYAPKDGQAGTGTNPWADYTNGRISTNGGLYTEGQPESICDHPNNLDTSDQWITGAYANLPGSTTSDQIEFVLHINASTNIEGTVKVKIFQTDAGGIWQPAQTFTKTISVAAIANTAYVGKSPTDCGSRSPCYVNSGDDLDGGLGTGLRDAVLSLAPNAEIQILLDYPIKDHTVLIDKGITLSGYQNALITYVGSTCSNPMLAITAGATLKDLTINDGNCGYLSRNLIEIDSTANVVIRHNTLNYGKQAIRIQDITGNVDIAFNHIANNQDYAVYREIGAASGSVNIYANNIINNRLGYQVNCNNHGSSNHNFWGEGAAVAANANNCLVSNGKQLGAPILLSSGTPGVEAIRKNVTGTMTYTFNGQIGVRHAEGANYDVIIVNHGQGSDQNIPFFQSGTDLIQACSNFYDVFLAENAAATDLVLALRYDLNSSCVSTIESSEYCSQTDSTKYPLWWYDPANNITDGWDRTGQNPEGSAAGGVIGQITNCLMADGVKEIRTKIDNSGRPGISNDLSFTPFVVGLPMSEGVSLSQFTAVFDYNEVDLKWITTSERNVRGFHILRSETESGVYTRISSEIGSIGDSFIGGIYNYTDPDIVYTKTYYYKIEVINDLGESIDIHGPVSVITSTATPTVTLTRTPTLTRTTTITTTPSPTRTATQYYYRSPTPQYIPRTSTPSGNPTAVRTFSISLTEESNELKPTPNLTDVGSIIVNPTSAYPLNEDPLSETTSYPIPGQDHDRYVTISPDEIGSHDSYEKPESDEQGSTDPENGTEKQDVRWAFILVGVASGLSLLGITSIFLTKTRI